MMLVDVSNTTAADETAGEVFSSEAPIGLTSAPNLVRLDLMKAAFFPSTRGRTPRRKISDSLSVFPSWQESRPARLDSHSSHDSKPDVQYILIPFHSEGAP
jgi:hypothetical protein